MNTLFAAHVSGELLELGVEELEGEELEGEALGVVEGLGVGEFVDPPGKLASARGPLGKIFGNHNFLLLLTISPRTGTKPTALTTTPAAEIQEGS